MTLYFNLSLLDETEMEPEMDSSANIFVAVITSLLGLVILIGNGLIIVAVTIVRKLRQPANYLIVSLALSDFLVGLVVLPLTITYDISEEWVFGATMCNIHVGFDVICCTTSIMNLCMISIDRYLMITRPMTYPKLRTGKLMGIMIAGAWIVSCLIVIPALFGFTENVTDKPDYIPLNGENRLWDRALNASDSLMVSNRLKIENNATISFTDMDFFVFGEKTHGKTCLISQEVWFTIYSTLGAFYFPLGIMLIMYWKIYKEASRFKARQDQRHNSASCPKGTRYSLISAIPTEDLASSSGTSPSVEENGQISEVDLSSNGRSESMLLHSHECEYLEMNPIVKSQSDTTGGNLLAVTKTPTQHRRGVPAFISGGNNFTLNDEVFTEKRKLKRLWNCFSSNNSKRYNRGDNYATTYNNNDLKYKPVPKIALNDKEDAFQPTNQRKPRASIFSGSSALQNSSRNARKLSFQSQKSTQSANLTARRSTVFLNNIKRRVSLGSRDRIRNYKATRTLGIIVGSFTFCWLPFFITTIIRPFVCENPESQDCFVVWLVRLVLWLGYLNSALNPIIYIGFSPDLRASFKFMLICKCRNVDRRLARIELRSVIEEERRKSNSNNINNNNNKSIV